MKKDLLKCLKTVLLVMVAVCASFTLNAQVVLSSGQESQITLESNSFSGITVHNTFAGFNHLTVTTTDGQFAEVSAPGYSSSEMVGMPKLPVMRKLIEIPVGATAQVQVVSYQVKEYRLSDLGINHPIMPAQPPVPKSQTTPSKFVISNQAYSTNSFQGSKLTQVETLGFMRGSRIARLDIAPIEYNPVEGTIRVYEDVVVKVEFIGGDYAATSELHAKTASPYFGINQKTFFNQLPSGSSGRENFARYPVKMVIVSHPMFHDALQPYIAWKIKKGFTVIEAYTDDPAVGTTTNSIKNYLSALYDAGTPEDPAPTFILFVGDVAQIPAFSQSGHVTDLYYCEYTGDYFPEVYYGRFSATSVAQLQPQIDKTLMYEKYLFPDPSFLGECVMVSGVDAGFAPIHGNGQINYGTSTYFNEAHGLLSHTYLYPASGSSSSAIIQNVSDGVAYGNYTAHGSSSGWADPSFEISDIPGLQNDGKYPLLVGNCCLTSTYNTNCFGEELLRAQNKGAIGYIGASNSTYWDEDFYFGVGVGNIVLNPTYEGTSLGNYDRAFHDHGEEFADWYTTMDQMVFAGNLAVTEGKPSNALYYWQIYCLMGDPSLMVYFGVPDAMSVTYEALMPLQSAEFTVNAAPYSYVAISKDGVLYGSALADENGTAVVALNPISVPGEADIVVTAQNRQPFMGTVMVASPEGPYIMLQSQIVNDENANNNQLPEFGESFGFNMSLKNVGNSEGSNLSVIISSTSPYVDIKTDMESWPDIAPGEIVEVDMAFEVTASQWLPDQHPAEFTLEITDGNETWYSSFVLPLNAPLLGISDLVVDDYLNGTGNGNQRMDPGENVVLSIPVNNLGHCTAMDAMSHLFTNSEGIDIEFIEYATGNIGSGNTKNALYHVAISPDVLPGTTITLYFVSESGVYSATKVFNPSVGLIIEDFETGDFSAFNWNNTSSVPWTVTNSVFNGGEYAAKSGAIGDNSTTTLQINMNVSSNDNISFARKVSSESGYDFLKFYIDGTEKGSWSGNVAWSVVTYPVTPGQHTFKWSYSKDANTTGGQDVAYIDDIQFPSGSGGSQTTDLSVVAFAYPDQLCVGAEAQLYAFVLNAPGQVSYNWTPENLVSDPEIFNPIALITDTTEFSIGISNLLYSADTTLILPVSPFPETPVIEFVSPVLVSSAAGGNQWYNSEGLIEGATTQEFEPLITDYYHVVVTSAAGCVSEVSNEIYVTVVDAAYMIFEEGLSIYPNPFSKQLNIRFNIQKSDVIKISLLDLPGREVAVLHNENLTSGIHTIVYSPQGLNPGIYFVKLETGNSSMIRKVVLSE